MERTTFEMLGKLRMKTSSVKTWKKFKVKPAMAITKAINATRIMMLRPFTLHKRGFDVLFFHV